jgi:hypothetical protein
VDYGQRGLARYPLSTWLAVSVKESCRWHDEEANSINKSLFML